MPFESFQKINDLKPKQLQLPKYYVYITINYIFFSIQIEYIILKKINRYIIDMLVNFMKLFQYSHASHQKIKNQAPIIIQQLKTEQKTENICGIQKRLDSNFKIRPQRSSSHQLIVKNSLTKHQFQTAGNSDKKIILSRKSLEKAKFRPEVPYKRNQKILPDKKVKRLILDDRHEIPLIDQKAVALSNKNVKQNYEQANKKKYRSSQYGQIEELPNKVKSVSTEQDTSKSVNQTQIKRQQIVQKLNKKQNIVVNQQNKQQKKQFKQIGVMTDLIKIDINDPTYKQFIGFKYAKKQKYQKIKHLMQYFDVFATSQQKMFKERKKLLDTLKNAQMITDRQKRIQDLIKNMPEFQLDFNIALIDYSNRTSVAQKKFFAIQQSVIRQSQQVLKVLQQKVLINLKKNHFRNEGLQEVRGIFAESLGVLEHLESDQAILFDNKREDFKETLYQLQNEYKIWSCKMLEKKTLINNCVKTIMQLPEVSLVIFGMDQQNYSRNMTSELSKFGINVSKIPYLNDIFLQKTSNDEHKVIDEAYNKICDVKCLNCSYLKSKMKYIYDKNIALIPILKALDFLTKEENQIFKQLKHCKIQVQNNS